MNESLVKPTAALKIHDTRKKANIKLQKELFQFLLRKEKISRHKKGKINKKLEFHLWMEAAPEKKILVLKGVSKDKGSSSSQRIQNLRTLEINRRKSHFWIAAN